MIMATIIIVTVIKSMAIITAMGMNTALEHTPHIAVLKRPLTRS